MAEKYMFFNSTSTDIRRHQASDMADYWQSFLRTGLINEGTTLGLQVNANGSNMMVSVNSGRALIHGHLYINDSDVLKTVEGSHATLNRIDRVVLRFDNSIESRFIKVFILKGTPSTDAIAPELTREGDIYELSLAQINVIAGKSYIEQSDIIDERLDEELCGLATALGHVPTDVYNAEFEAYMQQIAQEWQDWYNVMYDASFVTQNEYRINNRDIGRQLANLNAIADIDNRAIGNTGKFYDLFDGTNDMSNGFVDENKTTLSANAVSGANNITVYDSSVFSVGNEISIIGVSSPDSNAPLIFESSILSISGSIITLKDNLTTAFVTGSYVVRSLLNGNHPTNIINIKSYSNLVDDGTALSLTTTKNSIQNVRKGKYILINGEFRDTSSPKSLYKYDESTNSYVSSDKLTLSNDVLVKVFADGKYIVTIPSSGNGSIYKYDDQNDSWDLLITTPLGTQIYNMSLVEIDGILYLAYFVGNAYQSSGFITIVAINSVGEIVNTKTLISSYVISVAIIGKINNKIAVATRESGYRKVFELSTDLATQNEVYSVSESIGSSQPSTLSAPFHFEIPGRKIAYMHSFGQLKKGLFYYDEETKQYDFKEVTAAIDSVPISISEDGFFAVSANKIFLIDENHNLSVFNTIIDSTVHYGSFDHNDNILYFIANSQASGILRMKASTQIDVRKTILRYKIDKPIKNLAGWLFTNEQPMSVQVDLSLVDENDPESFQPLTVTQNGNEYEFLETQNLYTKDKATLKLTIEGTANLNKLLGAVE